MSNHAIEHALWDMQNNPALAQQFKSNPDAALQRYRLTNEEKAIVKDLDVRTMADRGADQMLLFVSWIAVQGFDQVPEYMRRMNTPASAR